MTENGEVQLVRAPASLAAPEPRVVAPPGVYTPGRDTALLLRALGTEPVDGSSTVLDLGTGSGILALHAARSGAAVTAVDVSWRAVWTARLNARMARTSVRVRRHDLGSTKGLDSVRRLGPFDLVLSNPPYVPSPQQPPHRGEAQAWDGGPVGRAVVGRVCDAAAQVLRPSGTLLMVHSALCGEEETLQHLAHLGMKGAVVDRAFVPFGPVMLDRRNWLCGRGLLDREAASEELVVVRAQRV
ncbi:methyltransferase [Streptomyces sp. SID5785]|uniref:HemK2/MTQ2 family protein methyltransferase n=1 Tax=Streptomyces sp. SID5785 TaxID=2690309 RepID=UPI0013617686|nr:HemK2/MTQ2 family protein methyltransferase [Streptomyces sp. SID5785]MZD10745.1 methyltransferase [Streptomyces sp. SID5785]